VGVGVAMAVGVMVGDDVTVGVAGAIDVVVGEGTAPASMTRLPLAVPDAAPSVEATCTVRA